MQSTSEPVESKIRWHDSNFPPSALKTFFKMSVFPQPSICQPEHVVIDFPFVAFDQNGAKMLYDELKFGSDPRTLLGSLFM